MTEIDSESSAPEPSRITAVAVDQYAAFAQRVRLELGRRRTVLVGHNGAGKSAILEAISQGLRNPTALDLGGVRAEPRVFELTVATDVGVVEYKYQWRETKSEDNIDATPGLVRPGPDWAETLAVAGSLSWRVHDGHAYWFEHPDGIPVGRGSAFFGDYIFTGEKPASQQRTSLMHASWPVVIACMGSRHVPAGVPRHADVPPGFPGAEDVRTPLVFLLNKENKHWKATTSDTSRATFMFSDMLRVREKKTAVLEEFVAVCLRLRLFRHFDFVEFQRPGSASTEEQLGAFVCDGTNAGLLSDGTLRVMEIVWALLRTPPAALLVIEEPETGIHPGLLHALFNEIDAYLGDRQAIISTHSPTVIDKVEADEIRIVTRRAGNSAVEPISNTQMDRLRTYLNAEGELAEFVFDGGL